MADSRPRRLPREDFPSVDLPWIRCAKLVAWRVHSEDRPAVCFRVVTGHRFSHRDAPAGLLYLGESLDTCLWECFGDELLDHQDRLPASRWNHSRLSRIESKVPLKLCDLADKKVRLRLGVDLSALMHTDLALPQAWGLALQNHPATLDGLRYLSRFTNETCYVLFERPGMASKLAESSTGGLPDLEEADAFLAKGRVRLV